MQLYLLFLTLLKLGSWVWCFKNRYWSYSNAKLSALALNYPIYDKGFKNFAALSLASQKMNYGIFGVSPYYMPLNLSSLFNQCSGVSQTQTRHTLSYELSLTGFLLGGENNLTSSSNTTTSISSLIKKENPWVFKAFKSSTEARQMPHEVGGVHWNFSLCDKVQDKENIVADALSRKYALFSTLDAEILGCKYIKHLYVGDSDFLIYLMHVRKWHLANYFGIIVFCLGKISFVCLKGHCITCLPEKLMRVVWWGILLYLRL